MKRSTVIICCMVLVGALIAIAADEAMDTMSKSGQRMMMHKECPICCMMDPNKPMDPNMKAMMTEAGITDQQVMMLHGMANAKIYMDCPGMMLGMQKDLMLTPDQVTKLMDIEKESRMKAMDVLTPEQKAKMQPMPMPQTGMNENDST